MPRLTLLGVTLVRISSRHGRPVILFGELPRWLNLVSRACRLPHETLLRAVGFVTRCEIHPLPSGETQRNFGESHLDASEAIVDLALQSERELREDAAVTWLSGVLGTEPAVAYALQNISHLYFAPLLLSWVRSRGDASDRKIIVVPSVLWPSTLEAAVSGRLSAFAFFHWPKWMSCVAREAGAWIAWLSAGAHLLRQTMRRRPRSSSPSRSFRVATEFVEPGRLNRGPHDVDYLVNDRELAANEVLFFVTQAEEARLRREGIRRVELEQLIREKKYLLVWLRDLPAGSEVCRELLRCWLSGGPAPFRSPWRGMLGQAIRQYTAWAGLFEHRRFSSILYLKFPNGNTTWRTDTAIVTSLARRKNTLSVGLQNRTVYARKYEASFECYDRYWMWGVGWYRGFGAATQFFGEVKPVGCIYLDAFPAAAHASEKPTSLTVAIFTGDITVGGHYSLEDNVAFLAVCLEIASAHPHLSFKVKCKDPHHADVFKANPALNLRLSGTPNLTFLRQARHSYRDLLAEAEIVLTIGFTTPGTEALLLGKKAFYYSAMDRGGEAYRSNPLWVAKSAAELKSAFEGALANPEKTNEQLCRGLDLLDPFRDGAARQRILADLPVRG